MAKRISRAELYTLVWSELMKTLATRFGISDVALKKTCARAGIPTPDRGDWAKKEAGKYTSSKSLLSISFQRTFHCFRHYPILHV
jgi:hypothetical protein